MRRGVLESRPELLQLGGRRPSEVEQIDLSRFYGAYRANGQGRPAYDPAMMVGLSFYAYCVGIRSSRQIERACGGDVAFKVITAMEVPDHSTVAELLLWSRDAGPAATVRNAATR